MVQSWLKIRVLLRHDQYRFVVFHFTVFAWLNDRFLDVGPNIWSVVPIQVNDLFLVLALILAVALKRNGVQIVLVSFASDDINGLMHSNLRVLLAVLYLITGQNAIIANLLEVYLGPMNKACSFLEILNFWELLCRHWLSLPEISAQGSFTHSWETYWNEEKLGNVLHFWVFE